MNEDLFKFIYEVLAAPAIAIGIFVWALWGEEDNNGQHLQESEEQG